MRWGSGRLGCKRTEVSPIWGDLSPWAAVGSWAHMGVSWALWEQSWVLMAGRAEFYGGQSWILWGESWALWGGRAETLWGRGVGESRPKVEVEVHSALASTLFQGPARFPVSFTFPFYKNKATELNLRCSLLIPCLETKQRLGQLELDDIYCFHFASSAQLIGLPLPPSCLSPSFLLPLVYRVFTMCETYYFIIMKLFMH